MKINWKKIGARVATIICGVGGLIALYWLLQLVIWLFGKLTALMMDTWVWMTADLWKTVAMAAILLLVFCLGNRIRKYIMELWERAFGSDT